MILFILITPFTLLFEECEKESFLNLFHIKINREL